MDRGDTTQGLGNPGENVDSYFHPLPSSLFSVQTRQALEIEGKFASSTKKRQSHLANPGQIVLARIAQHSTATLQSAEHSAVEIEIPLCRLVCLLENEHPKFLKGESRVSGQPFD